MNGVLIKKGERYSRRLMTETETVELHLQAKGYQRWPADTRS